MTIITRKRKSGKKSYEVEVYIQSINGERERIFETFDKFADAKDFERRQLNFKEGNPDQSISGRVLLPEVVRAYFEQAELSGNTLKSYKSKVKIWILPYLGHLQIGNINAAVLGDFIRTIRRKGIKPPTENAVRIVLKQIFQFATSEIAKYITVNPMNFIPGIELEETIAEVTQYWSKEEVRQFLREARKTPYYNMFVFMLNTGVRIGEVGAVKKESIDFNAPAVQIKIKLTEYTPKEGEENLPYPAWVVEKTKGRKARSLPLNEMAIKALKTEIENSGKGMFVFAPGGTEIKPLVLERGHKCKVTQEKYINPRTVSTVMKRICKTSVVKYIGPHGCRHTFSANFLMNGGNIYDLSKFLGHSSVKTTQDRYGHLSKEYLASAIKIVSFGEE